jgi:hypothetical protein
MEIPFCRLENFDRLLSFKHQAQLWAQQSYLIAATVCRRWSLF